MKKTASEKKKILILYARYGEGHKRAAQALEECFREQMPNAEIISEDFLGDTFPLTDWIMRKLYLQTFHWAKSIYGYLYYKTKDLPPDASLFQLLSYMGSWKLEKFLQEHQPAIVISTFPSLTGMLAKVKERGNITFSLWCVLTDYVSHSQWLYRSVDHYLVPTNLIGKELSGVGIVPDAIITTGIPVSNTFYNKCSKNDLLKKWGFRNDQTIVLVSAGAFGVTKLSEVCKSLATANPTAQFIVVCGRNHKLFKQITAIRNAGKDNIHPLPFVKEMDELMKMADLFLSKAGGLSISEAIAACVPMVLFNSLPGQETENANYLLKAGVAKSVEEEDELVNTVTHLINHAALLDSMKFHMNSLHYAKSPAQKITELVNQSLSEGHMPYLSRSYFNQQLMSEIY